MTDILQQYLTEPRREKQVSRYIGDKIRTLIRDGTLKSGDQLPSETELASMLDVSRNTLREALNILQHDGTIIRKQGVGTFVSTRVQLRNRLDINLGVTEFIQSTGEKPGVNELRINVQTDNYWAGLFDLPVQTPFVLLERTRTADDKPVAWTLDVFPESLLAHGRTKLSTDQFMAMLQDELSVYRTLEHHLGLYVEYGIARLFPAKASNEIAKKLGANEADLLVCLEQVDYDSEGVALVGSREYYLSDTYSFTIYRKR